MQHMLVLPYNGENCLQKSEVHLNEHVDMITTVGFLGRSALDTQNVNNNVLSSKYIRSRK